MPGTIMVRKQMIVMVIFINGDDDSCDVGDEAPSGQQALAQQAQSEAGPWLHTAATHGRQAHQAQAAPLLQPASRLQRAWPAAGQL